MNLEYQIILKLKNNSTVGLFSDNIPYYKDTTHLDSCEILENQILIKGHRQKEIDIEDETNLYRSTIYTQIMKALIFLKLKSSENCEIIEIEIKKAEKEKKLYSDKIKPLFIKSDRFSNNFDNTNLKKIFMEEDRYRIMLRSLFLWIQGMSSDDPLLKFENLWKAFNQIYIFHSKTKNETKSLIKFRDFMIKNESFFNETKKIVENMSSNDLRNKFRWRNLILNDHDTLSKTKEYLEFIKRYSDLRIMDLFAQTICYREEYLKQNGLLGDANNHIKTYSKKSIKSDIEVVCLIAIKYAYFIRCKYFHGEYNDHFFSLFKIGKNDDEISFVNNILSSLIVDTVNNIDEI